MTAFVQQSDLCVEKTQAWDVPLPVTRATYSAAPLFFRDQLRVSEDEVAVAVVGRVEVALTKHANEVANAGESEATASLDLCVAHLTVQVAETHSTLVLADVGVLGAPLALSVRVRRGVREAIGAGTEVEVERGYDHVTQNLTWRVFDVGMAVPLHQVSPNGLTENDADTAVWERRNRLHEGVGRELTSSESLDVSCVHRHGIAGIERSTQLPARFLGGGSNLPEGIVDVVPVSRAGNVAERTCFGCVKVLKSGLPLADVV